MSCMSLKNAEETRAQLPYSGGSVPEIWVLTTELTKKGSLQKREGFTREKTTHKSCMFVHNEYWDGNVPVKLLLPT